MPHDSDFQVLSEVHSALTDSITVQSHKLAETAAGAQSARNDAKWARSQVIVFCILVFAAVLSSAFALQPTARPERLQCLVICQL